MTKDKKRSKKQELVKKIRKTATKKTIETVFHFENGQNTTSSTVTFGEVVFIFCIQ